MINQIYKPKTGFTLAEVLITLGIIGVVAAMTLPTLIQYHRNKVVETRLEKFYSVFNQAIQMAEIKYGDKKYWYIDAAGIDLDEDGNPILSTSEIDKWFNKYLSNFIVIKRKADIDGRILYYLSDGSAFQFGIKGNASLRDIYFYPGNPERCSGTDKDMVGRCVFKFQYLPNNKDKNFYNKGLVPFSASWDIETLDYLKYNSERGCYADTPFKSYCTRVIQLNNWTIPKDYPWKVYY